MAGYSGTPLTRKLGIKEPLDDTRFVYRLKDRKGLR